jgi:hypothetical protein
LNSKTDGDYDGARPAGSDFEVAAKPVPGTTVKLYATTAKPTPRQTAKPVARPVPATTEKLTRRPNAKPSSLPTAKPKEIITVNIQPVTTSELIPTRRGKPTA